MTRASAAPSVDLPRGTLERAMRLLRSSITPYHREIYRTLLQGVLPNTSQVEIGLSSAYGDNFSDYAWYGARLLVLLARNSPVAQFALSLADRVQDIDLESLALRSEEELFPELFANPSLSEQQRRYLSGQLDNEYEVAFTRFVRLILLSTQSRQVSLEQEHYPDLVTLLTGELSPALRTRYSAELRLLDYYHERREASEQ